MCTAGVLLLKCVLVSVREHIGADQFVIHPAEHVLHHRHKRDGQKEAEDAAETITHHGDLLHIFTHIRLSVTLLSGAEGSTSDLVPPGYQAGRWVLPEERESLPQSRLMRKLRERLLFPAG